MKIAIQGHSKRGKEVIQILESLGGKSREELTGRRISQYYFINCNGDIDLNLKINLLNHKLYTLEEFEKEFPFKIGDKVITPDHKLYKIVAFENYNNKLCYKLDNSFHYVPQVLKPYKEMKEERNITLTLDKAKEWYKKGGELKEIALQAFTEKELNPLPKTWDEFCKNYQVESRETYIGACSRIIVRNLNIRDSVYDKNLCPSKESAEAHLAMMQLEQLRDCWRQGWKPDWLDGNTKKYAIKGWKDTYVIEATYITLTFLSFPTYKMAEEFLRYFRDLIEKAGDLL